MFYFIGRKFHGTIILHFFQEIFRVFGDFLIFTVRPKNNILPHSNFAIL